MRTPIHRTISSLSLSLLLILPAIPAGANGTAIDRERFDLHLQEALAFQGASHPFELAKDVGEAKITLSRPEQRSEATETEPAQLEPLPIQWIASEETSRIAFETQLVRQVNSHRGGFRKWIKKYWYVPVIAAAVVGVALSDDGSDMNDDED